MAKFRSESICVGAAVHQITMVYVWYGVCYARSVFFITHLVNGSISWVGECILELSNCLETKVCGVSEWLEVLTIFWVWQAANVKTDCLMLRAPTLPDLLLEKWSLNLWFGFGVALCLCLLLCTNTHMLLFTQTQQSLTQDSLVVKLAVAGNPEFNQPAGRWARFNSCCHDLCLEEDPRRGRKSINNSQLFRFHCIFLWTATRERSCEQSSSDVC